MATFDIVDVTKTIVRSIATLFPPLAPWVNAWNEHEAVDTKRRLDLFLQAFIVEANHCKGRFEILDQSVKSTREAMQVMERAVDNARREASDVKIRAMARVAANAMAAGDRIPHDDKLTLLEAIDTLTETDLATLGKFAAGDTLRVIDMVVEQTSNPKWEESLGRLVSCLRKLEGRGLVSETSFKKSVNYKGYMGDRDHWINRWLYKDFEILPLGRTLVHLLKEGGNTPVAQTETASHNRNHKA